MHRKKIITYLVKFVKSKFAVIAVLFAILSIGVVRQASASSENYNFSTCYQYYMLDNRRDSTRLQAGNQKIANIAPLGSGGISGTFSYNDIVNSAPNERDESVATKFVSMMATYSTFKYFSNKVQGFESWGGYVGRFLLMLLLLPLSVLMDFVTMLVPAMIKALSTFNIIPFLGSMLTNFTFKSGMFDALGLSKAQVTAFFNAFLAVAISFIIISLVMALRHGSQHIDQRHLRKFETRILTLIVLPLVIGAGATLMQNVGDLVSKIPALDATFARYLVDDRSWAYNYNFAPIGNSNGKSDIKGNSGSFVDLSFDPYDPNGRDRIAQINQNSSLAGKGSIFPNSALLLAYGMSQSFSATDYINFEGSAQSTHLLGQSPDTRSTFGSYYLDALQFSPQQLLDTHHAYLPSTHQQTNKKDQEGSYTAAIDDYDAGHHQLNTSNVNTWRDRFIYGVKNSGDLDKYYGETPSQEMIKNQVGGTSAATVPSDQSMFLILSTIFEENGGRYYINAPARGIKQVQGQFDSNRSEYYVVSMIGNPFFTIIGMLTQPLLTLVALLALILAILSVGLLDMNIKPFAAIFKAMVAGDIEYLAAFIFYTLGIVGTTVMFIIMPSIFVMLMTGVSRFVVQAIPRVANMVPQSAQQSLAFNGTPLIIQGFIALLVGVLWFRSRKFRDRLNELYCMPWNWAQAAARRVENKVSEISRGKISRGSKRFAFETNARAERPFLAAQKLNDQLKEMALNALSATPYAPAAKAAQALDGMHKRKNVVESNNMPNPDSLQDDLQQDDSDDTEDSMLKTQNRTGESQTPDEIKRRGQFDRLDSDLSDIQNDPNTSPQTVDKILNTQKAVNEFRAKPTKQNYDAAKDSLNDLSHHLWDARASKSQLASANKATREFVDIGEGYDLDPKKSQMNKPVMSQNSPAIDNDDSKHDRTPISKESDTNIVKPKSERPVGSEHSSKANGNSRSESGKTTTSKVVDKPDRAQQIKSDPYSNKGKNSGQKGTTVVKPKSDKPVSSEHSSKVNGTSASNGNSKSESGKTTTSKVVERLDRTQQIKSDPYSNKSRASQQSGSTTIVKPKSEKPVLAKHETTNKIWRDKQVSNNHPNMSRVHKSYGESARPSVLKHSPVRTANNVKTVVSKERPSGGSISHNTVQHMVKNSSHMHRTHITQIPKKPVQSKISKHREVRIERTNNNRSNIQRHSQVVTKTVANASRHTEHRPVVKVTNQHDVRRSINNRLEKSVVRPVANKGFVTDNQLKGIVSSLGHAMNDKRVEVSLHHLSQSKNISEVKHNIRGLQKVVRALDPKTKQQINKKNLVDDLFNLQNSNKFGGKK